MIPPIRACVFDAYGTLFDVHSAVARHAETIGPDAPKVSALWRTKQLEYTWVRSLMRRHLDFWSCTEAGLDFALTAHGLSDKSLLREALLGSYRSLSPYAEVRSVLESLNGRGIRTAILSNGTPRMLEEAIRAAGLEDIDLPLLSIEAAGIFKPDPSVYQLAVSALGIPAEAISFQSSNAWDIAGARAFGFHVVWVNRTNQPDEYDIRGHVPEIRDLRELRI